MRDFLDIVSRDHMEKGVIKTLRVIADELEKGNITMRFAMGSPPARYNFVHGLHSYTTGLKFEVKVEDLPDNPFHIEKKIREIYMDSMRGKDNGSE